MKKLLTILSILIGFFVFAGLAYALPPKPGMPGGPNTQGLTVPEIPQPQMPSQPELPPCVECDELGTPKPTVKPTPVATIEPTATPEKTTSNGGGGGGSSGGDSGTGGSSGQVLSLSATDAQGSQVTFLTLLGLICLGIGARLFFASKVSLIERKS